jgi:methylenetetrahydrofolate dehydrogenase (NADP+)/methenyltetrahydrofolate cyclohydrolase
MTCTIFPGRQLANQKLGILTKKIEHLKVTPKLQILLVGSDPTSHLYVKLKTQAAQKIGAQVQVQKLPASTSPTLMIRIIRVANRDPHVHGIMIQLPLPKKPQSHQAEILSAIDPAKDVDCLTPENLGLILHNQPRFLPATVKAVLMALGYTSSATSPSRHSELARPEPNGSRDSESTTDNLLPFLSGKRAVILGAGLETGKPLANLLSNLGATILWTRSAEKNLTSITRQADILITSTGQSNLITANHVKKYVIAMDIGTSKDPKTGKLTGDLDFDSVKKKVSSITPVPGGIGPLTVVSLLENLVEATTLQHHQ